MIPTASVRLSDLEAERRRRRRKLEGRVARFIREERLLAAGSHVLVAVSGGPDSSALLLILAALARRRRVRLTAAYFDHGLRGREATQQELEVVHWLGEAAETAIICGGNDVRALARREHLSIEHAARRARYAFLAATARSIDATIVATGHTADDQAETVLLHIIRGAGLAGLGGIEPAAAWPFTAEGTGLSVVRPLLSFSHAETIAYCEAAGVVTVDDPSNRLSDFRRNRIRHEVMPLMRELNPRVGQALTRLADAARSVRAGGPEATVRSGASEVVISRRSLKGATARVRSEMLRSAVGQLLGDTRDFGEVHWRALAALAIAAGPGHLDLPRGVVAECRGDALQLSLRDVRDRPSPD